MYSQSYQKMYYKILGARINALQNKLQHIDRESNSSLSHFLMKEQGEMELKWNKLEVD